MWRLKNKNAKLLFLNRSIEITDNALIAGWQLTAS